MTEWGIDTLFNPGKRHMDEEKRRLQSTREEIGDSSGGRRIDLESGTVTISRRNKDAPSAATATESAEAESEEAESEEAEAEEAEADDAVTAEAAESAEADDAEAGDARSEAGPQR
ncbi:MAG: DUF6191 domain-containing protein [Jatrophihabitantaceae bacterium]